jgi:hypothetical protein
VLVDVGGNYDIELSAGWNLISTPYFIEIPDRHPDDLLAGILDNLNTVYAYDACADPGQEWSNYSTSGPPGSLTAMRDGDGYWVLMDAPDTLSIVGNALPIPPQAPPSYEVCEGWNLIGFKSNTQRLASDYLAAIAGKYTVIYGYAGGVYFLVQGSDNLTPGLGYWMAVIQPGIIYP